MTRDLTHLPPDDALDLAGVLTRLSAVCEKYGEPLGLPERLAEVAGNGEME